MERPLKDHPPDMAPLLPEATLLGDPEMCDSMRVRYQILLGRTPCLETAQANPARGGVDPDPLAHRAWQTAVAAVVVMMAQRRSISGVAAAGGQKENPLTPATTTQ